MADRLAFSQPLPGWSKLATSEFGQTLTTAGAPGSPSRIAANLLSPGVALQFENGFEFDLSTTLGPILSWEEGSCTPDVPTPAISWVLLSFRDNQPPIFICLSAGQKAVFEISGQAGAWKLKTAAPFKGWLRVLYPLGTEGRATRTAADLGKLITAIKPDLPIWTAPAAELRKTDISADDFAIDVTWQFSGPAIVPPTVLLAPLGGYPLELLSEVKRTQDHTELGGTAWAPKGILKLHLPVRLVPPGRAIATAGGGRSLPGTVSFTYIPGIVDLGIEALRGDRDPQTLPIADGLEQSYLEHALSFKEPATQQQVFYDEGNHGLDVLAAHAFLNATVSAGVSANPDVALFTTAIWRRDWWTWLPGGVGTDPEVNRRAAGLLAVAGALFATKETRLQAAMFEAGLATERARLYLDSKVKVVDVLSDLRETLFASRLQVKESNQLLSKVRVLSSQAIWASFEAETLVLHFQSPTDAERMVLWLPANCRVEAGANLRILTSERQQEVLLIQVLAAKKGDSTLRVHDLFLSQSKGATRAVGAPDLGSYLEVVR